jgi:hypothetical protein
MIPQLSSLANVEGEARSMGETTTILPVERSYEFRRRLVTVHQPDRRDPAARLQAGEFAIGAGWSIVLAANADPLLLNVARDLQDYFLVSMGESLLVRREADLSAVARAADRVIVLATRADMPDCAVQAMEPRSYRLVAGPGRGVVCGADGRGAAQGSYYLEDLMNVRDAPFLPSMDVVRSPLFSPRMTHSGWGLDEYPDAYLNQIAHAGMDSILVFVTGVDRTPDERTHDRAAGGPVGRYRDMNDLVDRAAAFGLDVYFYAYFRTDDLPHPGADGAEDAYDRVYGAVFAACPRAKGIVLVGESVEFPSKDPHTTGRNYLTPTPVGLPATKPAPGWWPCTDYPEWIDLVKRVVRRHSPAAEIVFWTYNWGYAPEEDRLALIRSLPTDITLHVTFEMFEPLARDGGREICVDYTASFAGPGAYFRSEARVAHERGIRLSTMSNTGGLTWDVGVIPYEPVPMQWAQRHAALIDAHHRWGLRGLMESHHYGWWPSFVSDLAKGAFWTPGPTSAELLAALAAREVGSAGAPLALAAWQAWSEAILDYVPTNEDQYGPFRTGPSYPLVFLTLPVFPTAAHAMFGSRIFRIDYHMHAGSRAAQTAGAVRIGPEIRSLRRMEAKWAEGVALITEAASLAPERKRANAERLRVLGEFILCAVRTTIHVKEWWRCRQRLLGEADRTAACALLEEMAAIARREIANAEAAIPLVTVDSRLGWEPSMEYVCSPDHLGWKIAQVQRVLETELPGYHASLFV